MTRLGLVPFSSLGASASPLAIGLTLGLALALAACSSGDTSSDFGSASPATGDGSGGDGSGGGGAAIAGSAGTSESTGSAASGSGPGTDADASTQTVPDDVLTAGAWDDNRNFDMLLDFKHQLETSGTTGLLPLTDDEQTAANTTFLQAAGAKQSLDIVLMLDTTGSMGDEIAYLQSAFVGLAASIDASYPQAATRWSLVAYRDVNMGDAYTIRSFDFTTDLGAYQTNLGALDANGGGDFPESPQLALQTVNKLSWRTGADTAKLVFWVADAPEHDADAPTFADGMRASQKQGIHLYPVGASGIDDMTELTMREAAQLTGGRYQFLTDDSGIGDPHKVPDLPCYFVTKLDAGILRMVDIELTGVYREPAPGDIIRTGGNPASGRCSVNGQDMQVF